MFNPGYILLYVSSPQASAAFYSELLGLTPIENSDTFALFKLASGVMFGLWSAATVEPAATAVGGSELAFSVADKLAVDATHAQWAGRGLTIAQAPCALDFGYTFVALDADGHRLRVFTPG